MCWINVAATVINVSLVAVWAYMALYGRVVRDDGLSWGDFVTILLAASAVILTAVTVMVAVAAMRIRLKELRLGP